MSILISFPILIGLLIVQTAVVSQLMLLRGAADLILLALLAWALHKRVDTAIHWAVLAGLLVGAISGLPFGAALVGYVLAVVFALLLRMRVWQVPLLAMLIATFFGTLILHGVSLFALRLAGNPLPFREAVNLVTVPSILLNLLLAIPAFGILGDLANWIYPEELEV
jgi:rod shape-determining protein MreD